MQMISQAAAQYPTPNPYAAPYGRPTVSPYLNLDVTRDGLSNYPTLVRPLIEDQNAIMQQTAHIQRLEQQLRRAQGGAGAGRNGAGGNSTAASGPRFLNLSHYYYRTAQNGENDATRR
jgi:hypothetical protein